MCYANNTFGSANVTTTLEVVGKYLWECIKLLVVVNEKITR